MHKPQQIQLLKNIKPEEFIIKQVIKEEDIDYRLAEQLANEIRKYDKLSQTCFTLFDYYTNKFYYISENTPYFKNIKGPCNYSYGLLIENTNPEDVFIMQCIQQRAFAFLMKQMPEDRVQFMFTLNVRIRVNKKLTDTIYRVKPQILDKKDNIWISLASMEPAQSFTKPQITNLITGEHHFFKPIPIGQFKSYGNKLTETELEVLIHLSKGDDYDLICRKMTIKISTFKMHRWNIYKKLGTNTRISAVNRAFIFGLID
jgi:DNA-binding CsgD family transcriptional regulator